MTNADVKKMIMKAWESAQESVGAEVMRRVADASAGKSPKQDAHRERSTRWVDALAEELVRCYEIDNRNMRVFWKGREDPDFKLNELLFDIAVCETEETESTNKGIALPFVRECLWLVESELENSSRSIVVDLSKLVMGSSRFKLFVAGVRDSDAIRRDRREKRILKMCERAADLCACTFYFCFIPHPSVWRSAGAGEHGPSVWMRKGADWDPL